MQGLATDQDFTGDARLTPGADARLSVERLTLTDYRCYRFQRLETGPETVVLAGPNGAGKTNVLEALSFLVPGRGLRRARLGDVGRRDEADRPVAAEDVSGRAWAVAATLRTPGGPVDLGTGLEAATVTNGRERRAVHVDGEAVKTQAVLADHFSAQWLTPQMDRLFLEGPSARRRFLDRLVFGTDPAHAGRVAAYDHALRERSRLLRDGNSDGDWLGALEGTMAEKGVAVAAARLEMTDRLQAVLEANKGPFPGAVLAADGAVEAWLRDYPALEAEDRFREALKTARRRDGENGGTADGPHRSDLKVRHLAKGQPAEQCSTGEQKALLIAIVLANARLQAAVVA